MKPLPTGEELQARAKKLGVIGTGDESINVPGTGTVALTVSDYELQRRVLEAERHLREHRFWMVALISATASVISAIAAWFAFACK